MKNEEVINAIKKGKIFIYPTDTVYGLGCNAENKEAVEKIKKIKARDKDKPLSIISPSIKWIYEHCNMSPILEKYLPGPYTLILEKHNPNFLFHASSSSSLGIRIPDNKFTKIIQSSGFPFITTSVNLTGEKPAVNIQEIKEDIKNQADIIIEASEELSGIPSTLIINNKIIERK